MSVFKRPGQDTYSYDFWISGVRFSGNTGCTTKRAAQEDEKERKLKAKASRADPTKPMTFGVASSLYWDERGKFLVNHKDEFRALAWLQKQFGMKTLVSEITDRQIAQAVAKRRNEETAKRVGKKVSNATVNRSVAQPMRAILRRCANVWEQKVKKIDWKLHFLPEAEERVREASPVEESEMKTATRADYWPAIRFAILTGCRREEIVGLQWQHVDFFNDQFTVTGKRAKSRVVPMSTVVRDLLWNLKDHHKRAVFTYVAAKTRDGREKGQRYPITEAGFKTEWRRRGRAAVEDFRFHDTRHTAATRLVRKTGNLKQVQKLLGHTELATTARYAHVTNDDLRAGLEAANTTEIPTEAAEKVENTSENNAKVV